MFAGGIAGFAIHLLRNDMMVMHSGTVNIESFSKKWITKSTSNEMEMLCTFVWRNPTDGLVGAERIVVGLNIFKNRNLGLVSCF